MGNKTTPGRRLEHSTLTTARPSGDDGVNLIELPGSAKTDRWLVTATFDHESARALKDLATVVAAVTTVIRAKSEYFGIEGNGIKVAFIGDLAAGVEIVESTDTLEVEVHFTPDVSTVAQVEAAIAADSSIIEVQTAGATHTLIAGDAFALTSLAGGADNATTVDIFMWGRDHTSKKWGLHNDPYGRVTSGLLMNDMVVGRQHIFLRDVGNYDRIAFTRAGSTGTVTASITEILGGVRGN